VRQRIGVGLVTAPEASGKTGRTTRRGPNGEKILAPRREICISARSATVKKRAGSSVATDLDDIPVRPLLRG
jgi:hypothetical protein